MICVKVLVAQSCLTLCDPMDCSPPGSSVHKILQARVLEWVAMPSSKGIFPTKGSNPGLPHSSFRKAFLSLLAILWNSAFKWVFSFSPLLFTSLLFSAICKASSDNHFAILHFFLGGVGFDHHLRYNVTNLSP